MELWVREARHRRKHNLPPASLGDRGWGWRGGQLPGEGSLMRGLRSSFLKLEPDGCSCGAQGSSFPAEGHNCTFKM